MRSAGLRAKRDASNLDTELNTTDRKRAKLSGSPGVVPHFILINKNKTIEYYFERAKAAHDYLKQINNYLLLNNHPLVKTKIKKRKKAPERFDQAQQYSVMTLTADEMNAWLGDDSFALLKKIKDSKDIKVNGLSGMPPALWDHAVLVLDGESLPCFYHLAGIPDDKFISSIDGLSDEICNQLALTEIEDGYALLAHLAIHNSFTRFIKRLTNETCNKLAMMADKEDDVGLLEDIAKEQSEAGFLAFFRKLDVETINRACLLQNTRHNLLMTIAVEYSAAVFTEVLDKLSDDTCNTLALGSYRDKNKTCLLNWFAIGMPREQFVAFLNRLNEATCNKAAILQDIDGGSLLAAIAANQGEDVFISFTKRLTEETRRHTVLRMGEFGDSPLLNEFIFRMQSKLAQHPDKLKAFNAINEQLLAIALYDRGGSTDNWSRVTRALVELSPAMQKRPQSQDLSTTLDSLKARRFIEQPDFFANIKKEGWTFLRLQGRTILFTNKKDELLAVKIKKQDEQSDELVKEFNTTMYLRRQKNKLGLQSEFPIPISTVSIPNILPWLDQFVSDEALDGFLRMVGTTSGSYNAYIYQVNPNQCDYFTYLHDKGLSDAEFKAANHKSIHDLYTLLKRGVIFPQLGDVFHNTEHREEREDGGRYIVLTRLLRGVGGSGRLTGWREAVAYPNVRASGLADLGDRASINEYIDMSERMETFYSEMWRAYETKTGNYLLANVIAEYQYIFFLIAGRRASDASEEAIRDGKSPAYIQAIWQKAALQIVDNCVQAAVILTQKSAMEVRSFILANVNIERLTRQMQYWMSHDYIQDIMQNKIPDDIYGPRVTVDVQYQKLRLFTFNRKHGFSIDGKHQDLGPVNGQEPIKEANKLFYWMVSYIFNIYHQYRKSIEDLTTITAEKDPVKSEALRHQSFTYLPDKEFHALQMRLCKERLKQKTPLPAEVKESVQQELAEHRCKWVASTIATHFWQKKMVRGDDKMEVSDDNVIKRQRR